MSKSDKPNFYYKVRLFLGLERKPLSFQACGREIKKSGYGTIVMNIVVDYIKRLAKEQGETQLGLKTQKAFRDFQFQHLFTEQDFLDLYSKHKYEFDREFSRLNKKYKDRYALDELEHILEWDKKAKMVYVVITEPIGDLVFKPWAYHR